MAAPTDTRARVMTTTHALIEFLDGLLDVPVLVLMPNGDKLSCSPAIDADGTLVLVPEYEAWTQGGG